MTPLPVFARLTKSAEAISVGTIEIATGFALAMTEGGLVLTYDTKYN